MFENIQKCTEHPSASTLKIKEKHIIGYKC